MTVYIDDAEVAVGKAKKCRMIADNDAELSKMASLLRIRRAEYKGEGYYRHYLVPLKKRKEAIRLGAIPVSKTTSAWMVTRRRDRGKFPKWVPPQVTLLPIDDR